MSLTVFLYRYFYSLFVLAVAVSLTVTAQGQGRSLSWEQTPIRDTTAIQAVLEEGRAFIKSGIVDTAEDCFNRALITSRKLRYAPGMVKAFTGLSYVASHRGDYSKALNLLVEAERNNQPADKDRFYYQQFMIAGRRGQISEQMGNYDTAIYYYQKEMGIGEKNGFYLGSCYSNMGQLFRKIGNYDKSIYYVDLAGIEAMNNKDSALLCNVLLSKALTLGTKGDPSLLPEAIALTRRSLDIARHTNNREMQRATLSRLAGFAMNSTDPPNYKMALSYLEEALAIPESSLYAQVSLLLNLTYCYNRLHNFGQATIYMNRAKELAESGRSWELKQEVYTAMAVGYRHRGDYKNALEWYERATLLKDSLSGAGVAERVNRMQVQYESVRKDKELIYKELQITKQRAIIQQKNAITYSITVIALFSGIFAWFYYRNRRRMQLQNEKQALEIAAWQASISGEEKERSRLARELHDNIGGTMSTLQMWLGTIRNRHPVLIGDEDYAEAMEMLEHTITEVRNTAHHLMPELLLRLGLAEAARIFCSNMQRVTGIKIEYQYLGYIDDLDRNMELIFYRGIQELVQNVVKHADARYILVQLSRYKTILSVTVEDNGKGLDEGREGHGMGLESLRRSITHLGGQFSLRSEKGNGTTVYFETELSGD